MKCFSSVSSTSRISDEQVVDPTTVDAATNKKNSLALSPRGRARVNF